MDMSNDGIARWRRVADHIRGGISEGTMTGVLPSETELAATFSVNRHTVRRAISTLSAEGLLRAERGRGTFINEAPRRVVYPIGTRTRFSESMQKQSLEPSGRLIRAEQVAATSAIAGTLKCRIGTPLHKIATLAVADGIPISRSTSYFSAERFPGIVQAYAELGSITGALKREGLSDYRRLETRLTAERVTAKDAELLNCSSDAIVLITSAVDVDLEDTPIQMIWTKFLADRMELVFRSGSES
jgi:GntR family phosphonate transport system transcriptional regulator